MTLDEFEKLTHELASEAAKTIDSYVKRKIIAGRSMTLGEIDNLVVSAALFLVVDAVGNIKCRDCRRTAGEHVKKAIPEMLQGIEHDPTEANEGCGKPHVH